MSIDATRSVLESQDFVRATDIAGVAHFSEKNPTSQPSKWKQGRSLPSNTKGAIFIHRMSWTGHNWNLGSSCNKINLAYETFRGQLQAQAEADPAYSPLLRATYSG